MRHLKNIAIDAALVASMVLVLELNLKDMDWGRLIAFAVLLFAYRLVGVCQLQ
jgi:hypothetical protein